MSSDSDDNTPEDGDETPRARVRTRPGTPDRQRTTERARGRRRRRITTEEDAPTPETPADPMDPGPTVPWPSIPRTADGEPNPPAIQQRVRDLYRLDKNAATEFILETLHMLLLQHRPMDDIARIFGVTVRTVWNWRAKLRERIASDFRARIPTDLAAEQVANLKRTKSYAWQQAARCEEALDKLRWVNLTVKCEQELANLYKELKVYKAVEPRREITEANDDGAATLAKIAEEFLTGGYAGAQDAKKGKKAGQGTDGVEDDESDLLPPDADDIRHMF